jgi:hypothetical protein
MVALVSEIRAADDITLASDLHFLDEQLGLPGLSLDRSGTKSPFSMTIFFTNASLRSRAPTV